MLAALREIAGDLRESLHGAFGILEGGDNDARPEERAVLAHAPALVLELPVCDGHLQLVLGPAPCLRLLGIERGDMAAEDLCRGIALDALRALVPGQDVPGLVEQKIA
jgi:hypothetical protein